MTPGGERGGLRFRLPARPEPEAVFARAAYDLPMSGFPRSAAVDRLAAIVDAVETETLPVPVTEVWVYGDVALGLDPVERLHVYVTKEVLLHDDEPERAAALESRLGVSGLGRTVLADWAEANPELVRANDNGHAAPERCLAAHLLPDDEPVHLEVCNTSFTDNVTQRFRGALARDRYEEILDPRAVCCYADGRRSPTAIDRLRAGDYVFPTLAEAIEMLGAEPAQAEAAAATLAEYRSAQRGATVRGDVV